MNREGSQDVDLQQAGRAAALALWHHCRAHMHEEKMIGGCDQGQPTELWLPATSLETVQVWHKARKPSQWGQGGDNGVQFQV